jgi:hypothetical protein
MALWPSEKRQFPPFFAPKLPVFTGFFWDLGREGANWRGFESEKRWNELRSYDATAPQLPGKPGFIPPHPFD